MNISKIIPELALNKNIKHITSGSLISRSCKIDKTSRTKSSKITGDVCLAEHTVIIKSTISGRVSIGRYTYLSGPNIFIHAQINTIEIGNFCSIARGVQIQEYDHRMNSLSTAFLKKKLSPTALRASSDIVSKGKITIGHDVWIGTNAIITSGVTIGNGAVIAAGSIVTKNVPPYAIVAGCPAKIIKYRFSDQKIKEISETEWWHRPPQEILEINKKYE